MPDWVLPWASVVGVLVLFDVLPRVGVLPSDHFPPISETLGTLVEQLGEGSFWDAVANTLQGWALGLGIAAALAIPIGIVVGSNRLLYRALRGLIEFLRPIPSVALIPLAILIYGTGLKSKVFLAAFASFWQVIVATLYGVQDIDPVATDTARSFGLSRRQRLLRVTLPSAVPYIATGLRIASAVSLILAVTAELVIGSSGLGRSINLARSGGNEELMYALIITTGHPRPAAQRDLRTRGAARAALASLAACRGGAGVTARRRRWLSTGLEVTVPVLVLVIWGLGSAGSETYYFPPLTDILATFADTWLFERVGSDVVPSLVRMGAGFGIAVVVAIGAGLLLGLSPRARRAAAPIVEFLRAIPPPALLPFAILVIGVGDSMKVFIIAFVCVWPILLNTIDGVMGVDPTLKDTTRVYGISGRERLWRVMLPAASPQIFAGMRTSLSLGADPDGDQRDGGEHERHRLLRAPVPAHVRHPRDVVRDLAAGNPRLRVQRRLRPDRAARAALAPRRARQRAGLKKERN